MKKALVTATVQSHICQFHRPLAEALHELGFEIHAAARNNLAEKNGLKLDFVEEVFDVPFSRSPKSRDNIRAYKQLRKIIVENNYDLILCNTPMGGIVTRLAAQGARKTGTKVVYTAHGFHFYKGSSLLSWLIYYPIERFMAPLCDMLITINEEDYEFAKGHLRTRIERIHGVGVDASRYVPLDIANSLVLRKKEGLFDTDFVILCTGELNENKNQKTLVAAAAQLKNDIPDLKVLLAGNGPLDSALRQQIDASGLNNTVKLLGYRTDLEKVVPAVNLVVSCSHREGLALNIVEAMLCKKPVVASVNRSHTELIANNNSGYLVDANDGQAFADRIRILYNDHKKLVAFGENGFVRAQQYSKEPVKKELQQLLDTLLHE